MGRVLVDNDNAVLGLGDDIGLMQLRAGHAEGIVLRWRTWRGIRLDSGGRGGIGFGRIGRTRRRADPPARAVVALQARLR